MKNKIYKILVIIFYSLSLFILLFCLKIRLTKGVYLYTDIRLILLLLACLFIWFVGFLLVKKLNYTKKILRLNLIIYFIIYTFTIISLTLYDEIFGRNGIVFINWNKELLDTYMKTSFNIVPFNTIILFIKGHMNGVVSFNDFAINIYGNFLVLMPYGMFIPLIFNKINKFYKFFILMLVSVITIELLQFVTLSGSCDIDDLILNVLGASVGYLICKIERVSLIIRKIFLYE